MKVQDRTWLISARTQVEPQEKKKTPKGRAKKRITYTRRFVNVTMTGGKRKVQRLIHPLSISIQAQVRMLMALPQMNPNPTT